MGIYKEQLRGQVRESYGKLVYTYTSYHKMLQALKKTSNRTKTCQIGLSAVTTCGVISTIFIDETICTIITALVSAVLCGINLYFKEFKIVDDIRQFCLAADELWVIREKYISLLTDFDQLSEEQICHIRDSLTEETGKVYAKYPKTDKASYRKAQKAIKEEDEQFFTSKEIDHMLPQHLRLY